MKTLGNMTLIDKINTLNYNLTISEHKIGILIGTESTKTDLNTLFARAEGFAVESESYFTLSAATGARTNNGISTGSRLLSQFGKFNSLSPSSSSPPSLPPKRK